MSIQPKATADGSTLTLVAAYIGDGYLYGASDHPNAYFPSYWLSLNGERDGYELVELADVPAELAARLMADDFGDGYEAATAAAQYVGEIVHVAETETDDDDPDDAGPPIPFVLTADEADALAWLAARYESARILWDAWEWGDEENAGTIPAADVRAAYRATAGDGGHVGVVPCAGGGLAYTIAEAFEQAGCDR